MRRDRRLRGRNASAEMGATGVVDSSGEVVM